MKKRATKRITAISMAIFMLLSVLPMQAIATNPYMGESSTSVQTDNYLKLWYDEPAETWINNALPIGNGNLGGMVFGKTDTERVQVNEITLWAGGPYVNGYTGGNTNDV